MASKEDREQLAALAGTTVAFFRSNKELNKLFNKALDEAWTADRLLAASKNTKWFKNHSAPEREAQVLKHSDPEEYDRRVQQMKVRLVQISRQKGLKTQQFDKSLNTVARLAFASGWDDSQISRYLGSIANVDKQIRRGNLLGGDLAKSYDRFRREKFLNGVKVSSKQMADWMQKLAQGSITEEGISSLITHKAVAKYPGLAAEIRGGMTVREYADPYIDAMSELLELPAAELDAFNTDIERALNHKDEKGKYSPMTLADFKTRMRKDKRWLKTDNARESFMNVGHEVLSAFGVTW